MAHQVVCYVSAPAQVSGVIELWVLVENCANNSAFTECTSDPNAS